ncbi:hypothetical protein Sjap_001107 [Stephania japonica]|uniref:Uncharacterized protein n=1 Tax=Stephania japonica TaxID=461633 RepID=A0AAP0KJB8_9MAGN
MDPDLEAKHEEICGKIYNTLQICSQQWKRLDRGLFKSATKEDYLNLDTLDLCLHALIRSCSIEANRYIIRARLPHQFLQ